MHCPHCNHDPCRASTPQCDPLRPLLDFGLDVVQPYAEFLGIVPPAVDLRERRLVL